MAENFPDQGFDLLGQLLRIFAEYTFDIDGEVASESKERFKLWARHLLTGAAHPDDPDAGPAKQRDFRGARKAFGTHRQAEKEHVDRMVDVIWQMLSGLREAFAKDRDADEAVAGELDKLRASAVSADLSTLRSRVTETVTVVQRTLDHRRARHQTAMQAMGDKLRDLKTELADAKHQAETDGLTNLYNRASFDAHAKAVAQLSAFSGEPLSLLMVDVDHFKKLNDRHGHRRGDMALKLIADAIVRVASRRTDFVARYGGEEIVIVLADTPLRGAEKVAERILASLRKLKLEGAHGETIRLTASIGVATLGADETPESLVERADGALYAAKHAGRDRYESA